jgi:glycosyltransferase involved in cell wall biosynthesis
MSTDPRDLTIGFVIAAWNAERWIETSIRSLLVQHSDAWRLVIVDDGSTDATLGRVNALLARRANWWLASERIKVLTRGHRGLVATIADGMRELASVDKPPAFVTCLAADDYVSENYVGELISALVTNPSAPCVFAMVREFGDRSCFWTPQPYAINAVLSATTIPGCAVWRRWAWDRIGGFDARFTAGLEDWYMAAKAEAVGIVGPKSKPVVVPAAVYYHLARTNSLSDLMTEEYRQWGLAQIRALFPDTPTPPPIPSSGARVILTGAYDLDA